MGQSRRRECFDEPETAGGSSGACQGGPRTATGSPAFDYGNNSPGGDGPNQHEEIAADRAAKREKRTETREVARALISAHAVATPPPRRVAGAVHAERS